MQEVNKITVITINYNNREGLERTFQSVFSQTYKEFEYIVIDGGSTDGSKELIEKHSREITYWVSEQDRGIYNAMNKGIQKATGEYVLFINSGDEIYESETLTKCAPLLHGGEIISGSLKYVSNENSWIGNTPNVISFKLLYETTLPHPSTFIKRNAFLKVGLYDENFKICSDWKWFIGAICSFNLKYRKIDENVAVFYMDGLSSESSSILQIKEERQKVLQDSFPYLLNEYECRKKATLKLEGYESSRIIYFMKKVGFFKVLK